MISREPRVSSVLSASPEASGRLAAAGTSALASDERVPPISVTRVTLTAKNAVAP